MKRKSEAIKNFPVIYKILVFNPANGKFQEPKRGAKFFAYIDARVIRGERKRVKRHFNSFAEAKTFRASSTQVKDVVRNVISPKSRMTFKELTDRWISDMLPHLERPTQVRYRSYLKHFELFNKLEVEEISPSTIDEWISFVKRPEYIQAQNATRCGYDHEFTVLRGILNYYASRFNRNFRLPFLKDHNRMLKVREKSSIKKDLSIEEFGKFSSALRELLVGTRFESVYYMALLQYAIYGRIQDVAALYFEDFDFERKKIYIRRKVQWGRAKGEVHRVVEGSKANGGKEIPMNDFAEKIFREWVLRSGVRAGLLFHQNGEILSYRQIANQYDRALKKAELPFTGTHLIRHASLSEHYDTSRDILATAKVAGHSDLRATERYAKARDERVIESQQKMNDKLQHILPG